MMDAMDDAPGAPLSETFPKRSFSFSSVASDGDTSPPAHPRHPFMGRLLDRVAEGKEGMESTPTTMGPLSAGEKPGISPFDACMNAGAADTAAAMAAHAAAAALGAVAGRVDDSDMCDVGARRLCFADGSSLPAMPALEQQRQSPGYEHKAEQGATYPAQQLSRAGSMAMGVGVDSGMDVDAKCEASGTVPHEFTRSDSIDAGFPGMPRSITGRAPPATVRKAGRGRRVGPCGVLERQNTLDETKVLVSIPAPGKADGSGGGGLPHDAKGGSSADFEFCGVLGAGAFSDVFRVRGKLDGQLYAMKKGKEHTRFKGRRDRQMQLREVRSMAQLVGRVDRPDCPYILRYYQAWQEGQILHELCELCERGSVVTFVKDLRQGKFGRSALAGAACQVPAELPERTFWIWAGHVAQGLAHVHACGLMHLDIKPQNLLLTADGVCKIGDFGLASAIGEKCDASEGDSRYMAKELLQDKLPLHPSADVFSFGLSLFDIAARWGEDGAPVGLPTEGRDWQALRETLLPQLPLKLPFAQEGLNTLVPLMIQPDAARRPTCQQLLEVDGPIKALLGQQDTFVSGLPMMPVPQQPKASRPNLQISTSSSFNAGMADFGSVVTPTAYSLVTPQNATGSGHGMTDW